LKIAKQTIQVKGQQIAYQVAGRGDPVILVHGLSGSTRWWGRNVPTLSQRYSVYLIDLPGFGAMRRARPTFALNQAAAWLLDWMDAVGIKQAHFIGHSMGGYICIKIAAQHPKAVRRLVLVAPAGVPYLHTIGDYFLPILGTFRYTTPSFLPTLFYDGMRAGPRTLLRAAQQLLAADVQADLQAIRAPTLLIWGENDTLVPPAMGEILRAEIANARLLRLSKAGHIVMFDQADEFNKAVLDFLAGKHKNFSWFARKK
jgi:pimeloyl-ACP methyl ester carboxylesterase